MRLIDAVQAYHIWAAKRHCRYLKPLHECHRHITHKNDSQFGCNRPDYCAPKPEGTVLLNAADISNDWPTVAEPILGVKASIAPLLCDMESPFILGENS